MDHYPGLDYFRVKDESLRPAEWLLFNHGDHEPCALEDYPIVRGWSANQIDALKRQDPFEPFSTDSLAMIQSWMFLGSLESLTCRHISEADFLRCKLKRPVVHTGFLTLYLIEWIDRVKKAPDTTYEDLHARLDKVTTEIRKWCYKLAASAPATITTVIDSNDTAGEVIFAPTAVDSVARLLTLVGETIRSASGYLPRAVFANLRAFAGCYTPDEANRLTIRLAKKGWCPYMARMLFTYGYSVAEYAAFYSRYRQSSISRSSHNNGCTGARCIAHDVDTENYVTRHIKAGCSCTFVAPPLDQVLELLRNDKVPVIYLRKLYATAPELGVTSSNTTDENTKGYLAFSHVWSDGLGSNTARGLPQCVIQDLFEKARAHGQERIWIDSLCVPSDAQRDDRKRAINLMAKTYLDASATIVLDSSIRAASFDLTPSGIGQTLLSLVTSAWCQRLWTLQEARLSRTLIFQFYNIMATAHDIWLGLLEINKRNWHVNPVTQSLASKFLKLIRPSQDAEVWMTKNLNLGDISRMLHRRQTSKLIDETVAIAGLVEVDISYILEGTTSEDRMKRFLTSLRKIPSDIILYPMPRLNLAGFRWAPSSFMSHEDTERRWVLSNGTRTRWAECLPGGGLKGQYRLLSFSRPVSVTESNTSIFTDVDDKSLKVKYFPFEATSFGAEGVDFDTVATLPYFDRSSIMGLQMGAALLTSTFYNVPAGTQVFEYKGRVIVGDQADYQWPIATNAHHVSSHIKEDVKILII